MKKIICLLIVLFSTVASFAMHLKGGWIQYEYLGVGSAPNTSQYRITVRQYLLCSSTTGQIDANIVLGIFYGATNTLYKDVSIAQRADLNTSKTTFDPCLNNPPSVCYKIDTYVTVIDLPDNPGGYILAVQRCCRIQGIVNVSGSQNVGVTYTNTIPGTIGGVDYHINSSPAFAQKDTAIVCFSSHFTFDFSATDADGDVLVYTFCSGLDGGSTSNPGPGNPTNPPYNSIPYTGNYSGGSPLGLNVTIDPNTGIISGIAPATTGDYVVAVCVQEYRNGILIGTTKKEIHISVADCSLAAASLNPTYINCNTFTEFFQNESASPAIVSYLWTFGDPLNPGASSTSPTPSYTYTDTGTFTLKLKVVGSGGCQDSANALVKIYPGYSPGFKITGSCYLNPYQFTDTTNAKYPAVNSWAWNFGDNVSTDTSSLQNPLYTFASSGPRTIQLIVASSKGCIDTVSKVLNVSDKPAITLPFKDTLICSIDTLPLISSANGGTYSWSPNYNISSTTIAKPFVFPKDTTTYVVTVNNNGCINKDSIKVNVLQFISVDAGPDTGICRTDTIQLNPVSYALSYVWTSSTGTPVNSVKYPTVQPLTTTRYYVLANLGKCQAHDSVLVKVAPYPFVAVSGDTVICFGDRVQLLSVIGGSAFAWTPTNTLLNPNTPFPVAGPVATTAYTLFVTDTIGCPKPVSGTVTVTVIPKFNVNAGKDTTIVAGQPLQLQVTGGPGATNLSYSWTPTTGLDNPLIATPIATLPAGTNRFTYTARVTTSQGCYAEDAVNVIVFNTGPEIFVPSAFTPNGDGKNDILRPVPVGIVRLDFFRVYNRWGQLVYSTSEIGNGWNGNLGGTAQPSGAYVFEAQGLDYLGKTVFRKGTCVLIR